MESKFGFIKMDIGEFVDWLQEQEVDRMIRSVQQHHTFRPNYAQFKGDNHFKIQRGMKNYHTRQNGWSDIGQHFSIFPDGQILTGRSLEAAPACIGGNNSGAICLEHIGDFDTGKDQMTKEQKETIVYITAALCYYFDVPVNSDKVVYHHWFDLSTRVRNNGTGMNKSCPGTAFFGGNKVEDCDKNFLPLVQAAIDEYAPKLNPKKVLKYVEVTADQLNVRIGPGGSNKKVGSQKMGSHLKVYKEENNWYEISGKISNMERWVSARFTKPVKIAMVTKDHLIVRSGPGNNHSEVFELCERDEVFIHKVSNGWAKIGDDDRWADASALKVIS